MTEKREAACGCTEKREATCGEASKPRSAKLPAEDTISTSIKMIEIAARREKVGLAQESSCLSTYTHTFVSAYACT